MKYFLTTSFITIAFLVAASVIAPAAHAQALPACTTNTDCPNGNTCVNGACQLTQPGANNPAAGNPAAGNGVAGTGAGNPTNASSDNSNSLYDQAMIMIMGLFAWLAGIAMITLNYAMYYTVIVMGTYIKGLSAIGVTWRILRDIGNIVLIFGFLAVGIATILNATSYGIKKMLPMLLIVAVLLNFSLFLSEAVIDIGNLFAVQFYTQINGGNIPTPTTLGNHGISDTIMAQLGVQTIYGDATNPATAQQILKPGTPWYIGFMGSILFIVLAFVLFSLAFILIVRFIVLIFLIIVAPIGFAGLIVPKLDNTARKWWSTLFEQTITAPVLLLLLYIALAIITDANFLTGFGSSQAGQSANWLETAANTANLSGFAAALLSFIVAMGLLLAVVIFAKRMSAAGGGWATKTAGALTFGAVAWGANRTVGRGAYYLNRAARQNKTFNKINAATGRIMTRTLDRAATGTFDLRATGALKSIPGGAGEARKGGFVGASERTLKSHQEEVRRIDTAYRDRSNRAGIAQVDAQAGLMAAKAAQEAAQLKVNNANAAQKAQTDNIVRLEETEMYDKHEGRPSSVEAELKAARENLSKTDAELADSVTKLGQASEAVKAAARAGASADETRKNIAASARASKVGYAEGSQILTPINWVAYGPSTGAAARQIINDAKKTESSKDQLAGILKKMAAEEEQEKGAVAPAATASAAPAPNAADNKSA